MPHAYSTKDLHRTYNEIALERPHICDECGTNQFLSHSHLMPKGLFGQYAALKQNIVYHCMDMGNHKGCHTKWDSMEVAKMKTFEKNYRIMYHIEKDDTGKASFFWQKMHKLLDFYISKDFTTYQRVRSLFAEIDHLEHPRKTIY